MIRIASIWLPKLAIERWAKSAEAPERPVVLVVEAAHGPLIHAATSAARAAWGLARYGPSPPCGRGREPRSGGRERGLEPYPLSPTPLPQRGEGLEKDLAPLPVAALRLDARSVQILHRLGLKTIGDL